LHTSSTHSKQIVGKKIKTLRVKRKLTQQGFADLMNIDRQYVSKIEKGKKNITLNYLDKIITKLECTHNDFFNTK